MSEVHKVRDNPPKVTRMILSIRQVHEPEILNRLNAILTRAAAQILSVLFSIPQTSLHDLLKPQQRLAGNVNLRTDELRESSGPKAHLAHSEEDTVIDSIGTQQRAGDYVSLCEVRDSASRLLSERFPEGIALGSPGGGASEGDTCRSFR
jgi:hypothetical protein